MVVQGGMISSETAEGPSSTTNEEQEKSRTFSIAHEEATR